MPKRHYTLYCDESSKKGPYFSNFYGGALVQSRDREAIETALREKKEELNLHKEIKWTNITKNYQDKYINFIKFYFEFVKTSRIKIRIMFTQNMNRPTNLSEEQEENRYFLLYYQLIKHGFGLRYSNPNALDRIYLSILLDKIPDTHEKLERFKQYLSAIPNSRSFAGTNIHIERSEITDVDSKKHNILQGLDIILGSMHFRLNDLHKMKPEGAYRRGNRTIAKEAVYKEINRQIREIYPGFNIGISIGTRGGLSDRWNHPYRHWLFRPKEYEREDGLSKREPR